MKIKFFNPGLEFIKNQKEYVNEYIRVRSNGDLILRDDVKRFEESLAKYCGTKYAVGLNSCTDALELALRALKIGPGDDVLVPSRTFVASVQVIVKVGANPVFYDLDGTLTYGDKVKAIIPVHIEGAPDTNFQHILDTAKKMGWYVIEDAAQSLGAEYEGKKVGSIGDVGCFSFYPAKTLGCPGDGGALVTNNEKIYKWVKDARNHFKEDARDWGVNSRLDNVWAAELNLKFNRYEKSLARRKEIADIYLKELRGVELPTNTQGRIWQDFIIRTSKRNELFSYLKERDIETMKNNYPFPVPKLPLAQKYEDETLRLPCNDVLENSEIQYVIEKINEFYDIL